MPATSGPGMDAVAVEQFLDAAFGGKPEDAWFLLWTLPDRASRWHKTVETAVADATTLADHDLYVGVALSAKKRAKSERGKVEDAAGIVGLWADIDIADETAHKKPNLPPDENGARLIVKSCGLDPTVLVHSGHGLQAWWLFTEPWWFDSATERGEAQNLALQWNATLRMHSAQQGWVIDSTHDLTRVLRLPGSVNHKDVPIGARLLDLNEERYEPSDFEPYLADSSALSFITGRRSYHVMPGTLKLDPNVQLDFELLDTLLSNAGRSAKQTWEHARSSLPDQSASSYDLAMANIAVSAGWSDQQIADLLIMRRRKAGDDLKLRADYYARTIGKARDQIASDVNADRLDEAVDAYNQSVLLQPVVNTGDPTRAAPTKDQIHKMKSVLDIISTDLKIEIIRVEDLLTDPKKYRIVTPRGSVLVEGAREMLDVRAMRGKLADVSKVVIPLMKQPAWDRIAQALLDVAIPTSLGEEATDAGLARSWLDEYLSDRPLEPDFTVAAVAGAPHRADDGRVFVPTEKMKRWVRMHLGEKLSNPRFGNVMASMGCVADSMAFTRPGGKRRTTISGWWLPDAYAAEL